MRPVIVMPFYDPNGLVFPHLKAITPQLKELFEAAFVSIRPSMRRAQAQYCEWLMTDTFFHVYEHPQEVTTAGEDFLPLYAHAAASCPPAQVLHLCFADRVVYALQSEHQEQFRADMQRLQPENCPVIFQRTTAAWQTHPQNYQELEQMVTKVGEFLFGKSLDFAWCHFAIQAGQLQALLPKIQARDLSLEAEMVLLLIDSILTKDVDWLAWEDPFIENCDPQRLKGMREASVAESCKRLSYVVPMLQLLRQVACK
jgi:hypothetical protein